MEIPLLTGEGGRKTDPIFIRLTRASLLANSRLEQKRGFISRTLEYLAEAQAPGRAGSSMWTRGQPGSPGSAFVCSPLFGSPVLSPTDQHLSRLWAFPPGENAPPSAPHFASWYCREQLNREVGLFACFPGSQGSDFHTPAWADGAPGRVSWAQGARPSAYTGLLEPTLEGHWAATSGRGEERTSCRMPRDLTSHTPPPPLWRSHCLAWVCLWDKLHKALFCPLNSFAQQPSDCPSPPHFPPDPRPSRSAPAWAGNIPESRISHITFVTSVSSPRRARPRPRSAEKLVEKEPSYCHGLIFTCCSTRRAVDSGAWNPGDCGVNGPLMGDRRGQEVSGRCGGSPAGGSPANRVPSATVSSLSSFFSSWPALNRAGLPSLSAGDAVGRGRWAVR